ncbi:wax ester synthase/diacylglycerol acyltransferase 11-like [Pyrus x bretschneideri]|uniref:wax ester synthase/diacylglycerol acyltransferase 11-like n=1 Tax=Pyrus x bretschneideri TaxID=225117 RepID=UPI00202F5B63|nr:wax ester synthase/diacylglycerol acyltransferase 11-like [Pyrus x bretschneideri]
MEHLEEDEVVVLEPVSPTAQYFTSSVLSVSNIGVMELENPLSESQAISLLKTLFLPISPRFSSIVVEINGKKRWKRVEVKLEEHISVPIIPSNLSTESYEKYLDGYISKLALERLSQDKPLWELHILNYPTRNNNAACNLIFKLHHALGDGFSLMSAILSCLRRADNPSLPLTFPSRQRSQQMSDESFLSRTISSVFNTLSDIWRSTVGEDDISPIRSGNGIEFQPITVATMTFSLDQIKSIKSKLGVTVNDVLAGMIFLGTRLYMQEINRSSSKARGTAVVLLNTRMMGKYTSIQEMMKPDSKMPWGNHFTFLHVPIPNLSLPEDHDHDFPADQYSNALDFVWEAQKIITRKRSSLAIYLTCRFLEFLNKFGGHEAAARYIHSTLKNTSMMISNLIGPVEQMALANNPVKGMYFLVFGSPEGLDVTIVSYMGKVRVAFKMEKGLIEPQKFKSCMQNAFEMIRKASDEYPIPTQKNSKTIKHL